MHDEYLLSPFDARPKSGSFFCGLELQSLVDRVIPASLIDDADDGVYCGLFEP